MSFRFVWILLVAIPVTASDIQKQTQQIRHCKKELPYAVLDNRQVIIIQNPQQDKHVHTVKRSQATILKLIEHQHVQSAKLRK